MADTAEMMEVKRLSELVTGVYVLAVTGSLLCQESAAQALLFVLGLSCALGGARAGLLGTGTRDTIICLSFYLCVWTDDGLALFLPRFALRKR